MPSSECPRTEEGLQGRPKNLEELINRIDGIIWEADAQRFRFTFVSRQAERILGHPVEQWINEPTFWKDHLHPDDRESTIQLCAKATKEQRDHDSEYRMVAADGRIVWLWDMVSVIVKNGEAAKLQGVMVDLTERKQAEEALAPIDRRV